MLRYPSARSVVFVRLAVVRSSTKSLFVLPSVGWGPPLRPGFRVQDFAAKVGGPLHQTLVERAPSKAFHRVGPNIKSVGSGRLPDGLSFLNNRIAGGQEQPAFALLLPRVMQPVCRLQGDAIFFRQHSDDSS